MKNLICILGLLVASSAYAEGPVLVRFDYAKEVNGGRTPFAVLKVEIAVDEEGVAQVVSGRFNTSTGRVSSPKTETRKLTARDFRMLKEKLSPLYTTPVDVTHSPRVCARLPRTEERFRNLYVKYGGRDELRLIMNTEGCWVRLKTRPANEKHEVLARGLKERLQKIADGILKK